VVAAIHVVAHEQVIGVRDIAADAEKLFKVMELPMYITAHRDGALYRRHIALLAEHLTRLGAGHARAGRGRGNKEGGSYIFTRVSVRKTANKHA